MPPLNQMDHRNISWWTASEGWPEERQHARAKYVFAARGILPYGTYVINGDVLRVETPELLKKLNEEFEIVRRAIIESMQQELNRLSSRGNSNGSSSVLDQFGR
jgi:hypothetical protein